MHFPLLKEVREKERERESARIRGTAVGTPADPNRLEDRTETTARYTLTVMKTEANSRPTEMIRPLLFSLICKRT